MYITDMDQCSLDLDSSVATQKLLKDACDKKLVEPAKERKQTHKQIFYAKVPKKK